MMIYAPIIIPTLNRVKHLNRCITSLQHNCWAAYTPLVISVDYPPSEKYVNGYEEVCDYLKQGVSGFASVEIFYQKKNLGAYDNEIFLRKYVSQKYDRYIFTEDDNEFSKNFIEYIDKGLEIFEKEEDIVAICCSGISDQTSEEENVVKSYVFSAYGYGTWIKKESKYFGKMTRERFENMSKDYRLLLKLAWEQPRLLFALQNALFRKEKLYQMPNGDIPIIDETISIYLYAEKKFVVNALNRKTRNWGYDGSGLNCNIDKWGKYSGVQVDQDSHFEYKFSNPMRVYRMNRKFSLDIVCRLIMALIKLTCRNIWIFFRNNHV